MASRTTALCGLASRAAASRRRWMVTASRVKVTLVVAIPLPYYHTASLPAALRQYGHARAPRSVLWTGSVVAEHGSGCCAFGAGESSTLFLTPVLNGLYVLA